MRGISIDACSPCSAANSVAWAGIPGNTPAIASANTPAQNVILILLKSPVIKDSRGDSLEIRHRREQNAVEM